MTPLTWGWGSVSPSVMSVLVTLKLGTWGRKSYGFGGRGRSAMVNSLGLGRTADAVLDRDPRPGGTTVQRSTSQFSRPGRPGAAAGRPGRPDRRRGRAHAGSRRPRRP